MIIVAGSLIAHKGQRDALVAKSKQAIVAARQANGCLAFSVSADPIDADRVVVLERWESRNALEAFRGKGPDSDIGSEIAAFDVHEYEVVGARS
jgi:quinol monooxygenase YgiN